MGWSRAQSSGQGDLASPPTVVNTNVQNPWALQVYHVEGTVGSFMASVHTPAHTAGSHTDTMHCL